MSNLIQAPTEFQRAVEEYLYKEKIVGDTFIKGVVSLGQILEKQRDYWRPLNEWDNFCTAIGKSRAGANQFIRIYQCSKLDSKLLYDANLTDWHKVNLFLALPKKLQNALAKSIGGEAQTDEEWDQHLEKFAPDKSPRLKAIAMDDAVNKLLKKVLNKADGSGPINTQNMAAFSENILEILKKKNPAFTDLGSNYARILSGIFYSISVLNDVEANPSTGISSSERRLWDDIISNSANALLKKIAKI